MGRCPRPLGRRTGDYVAPAPVATRRPAARMFLKSCPIMSLCSPVVAHLRRVGCCVLLLAGPAAAQPVFAPSAPDVVSRDSDGRATVRATRITEPLQLDEPFYDAVRFVSNFVQQLSDEGDAGSERTEAWVLFDDDNIYISARNYDRAPTSQWVVNEMRRDVIQLRQNDSFSVMLDAFYDRRNGLAFLVTPLGWFSDFAITNEGGSVNSDWNTIWDSRTGRFDGGWTVEMRIPFKSLRYRPTEEQLWGIQLRRIIRRFPFRPRAEAV